MRIQFRFLFILLLAVIVSHGCKKHKYYRNDKGLSEDVNYPAGYIIEGEGNAISILNLNTNLIQDKIELKGSTFPHHIYLSPDKTQMAVAFTVNDLSGGHAGHHGASGDFMVQLFNTKSGEHVRNLFLDKVPHNAIFSPDGENLWVGQLGEQSQIIIYSTKKYKKEAEINVGSGLSEVTFNTDGTKAYAANTGSNTVSIIDVSKLEVIKTLDVGTSPVGAWPAKNGKMYVDCEESQTIHEIDVTTDLITSQIDLNFKPGYVAFNELNKQLWASDATNGQVVIYTYDGINWVLKKTIITGADAHAIVFNSAETLAYVTNQGSNTISVIDVVTEVVLQTISVGSKPNGIALIE